MIIHCYIALNMYKYIIIFNMLINNPYYKIFTSCYITSQNGI